MTGPPKLNRYAVARGSRRNIVYQATSILHRLARKPNDYIPEPQTRAVSGTVRFDNRDEGSVFARKIEEFDFFRRYISNSDSKEASRRLRLDRRPAREYRQTQYGGDLRKRRTAERH